MNHGEGSINRLAVSATLHCLTGCGIGEVLGLIIGQMLGFGTLGTIGLAVGLAFLFGYGLSLVPLLRHGMTFRAALPIVLAADTLSILTMEIVDNAVMVSMPGALHAGLDNLMFWVSMALALFVAFWVALPVNRYLLMRGKGHAVLHAHHHGEHGHDKR